MEPIDDALNEWAHQVVDSAYQVHRTLGPGLLEGMYESCLAYELDKRGIPFERQVEVPVYYDGLRMGTGYKIDVLVAECLIVELKTVETVSKLHKAQLMTYMKLLNQRLGLLINFNVPLIRDGITRLIL